MASASPPGSEADTADSVPTDIVVLGEATELESTSATSRQLPSLLDRLKCPRKSDLCRKRKVQSVNPTAVKKRHQPGTLNPTDPKGVTCSL